MPRPAPGDRSHLQKKILNTGYPEIDGDKFNPSDYILDQLAFRGEISDLMQRMFVPPLIMSGLALSNSGNDLLVSNGAVYAEIPYDTVIPHNNTGAALTSLPQTGMLGIANGVSLLLNIPSSGAIGDNTTLNTVRAKVVWLDGELRNRQSNPLSTYSYVRKARLEIAINPGTPANYPIQLGQFQCTIVGPNVTTFTVIAGARSEDFHFQFEKAPTSEADAVLGNELMRLSQFLAIFSTAISDAPAWNETLTAPSARAVESRFVDNVSNESIAGVKTLTNTTESTDKDTGGLITEGGLGVEKRINAGGRIASGTTAEGNLPPASNNDLTRKDWIEQRATHARRQTVAAGRMGAVHADFIEPTTGLAVAAKADSTNPIITTIASGFHADGAPKDFVNRTEADKTFSGLTANATNFLGLKRISAVQVDPVTTLLPPVYGQIFSSDRENKINASFNGTNGDTEFIDPYGNFFKCYGPGWQISNVNTYSGFNTLRCEGVNNSASANRCELVSKLDQRSLDQWTIECFFRADSITATADQPIFSLFAGGAGTAGMDFKLNPSGVPIVSLSNDELAYNIWGDTAAVNMNAVALRTGFGTISATSVLQSNQWYHVAWVFNGLKHMVYINGYLVNCTVSIGTTQVFTWLKPSNPTFITLGAKKAPLSQTQKLTGNIANFAFHPYAKYQTKIVPVAGDTPAARDVFTPPVVPLSLTVQTDRYYEQSEAIYLDFEDGVTDGVFCKDAYGRQLVLGGNQNATLTTGAYIESGAAKFGTKSLLFNGTPVFENCAIIRAPVWADKYTMEFWAFAASSAAVYGVYVGSISPATVNSVSLRVTSLGNGANIEYYFRIGTTDSSADILSAGTGFLYSSGVYNHIAITYDGVTYRCFVNGSIVLSAVSQLKMEQYPYLIFGRTAGGFEHLTGKLDDFAYVPYCKYASNFTPPAAALLSSMPEQYLFDTKKMQMYKGYPTAFVAENTVFIGEALTSALNIEQVITYALNGEYEEEFSCDFLGTPAYRVYRSHKLGTQLATGKLMARSNGVAGIPKGTLVDVISSYYDGASIFAEFMPLGIHSRNLAVIFLGYTPSFGPALVVPSAGGATIGQFLGSNISHLINAVVVVKRSF